MEWWRRTKAMALTNWAAYQWIAGIGLAVLVLEVLVIVLRDDLPTLLVFLIIDASGTLVGLWIVKTGRRKTKPGEQQSYSSSLREEMERAHFFLENHEDDRDTLELLRQAGFTTTESDRLCRLRKHCAKQKGSDIPADVSRLKFVRWLVATGKLTDQL